MNTPPNHRIMQYEALNANPLKASDAETGFPSPWNTFARTAKQAIESVPVERISLRERLVLTIVAQALTVGSCEMSDSLYHPGIRSRSSRTRHVISVVYCRQVS
jgi:hypothetical protein